MAFGAEFGGRGGWRQSAGSIGWATASQSLPEPNPIVSRAGQRRRKALNVAAMRRDGALPHCGKTACGAKKFHVGVDRESGGAYTAFIDGGAARDCGGRGWFFSGFPERIETWLVGWGAFCPGYAGFWLRFAV
jgi:hypothetical protein